jgi:2'-hydroxyisoflavone reductase
MGLIGLSGLSAFTAFGSPKNSEQQPLKILVLGGTGFLGPHLVNDALQRGHTVTLFNRGKTDPQLFPDLEKLKGQRAGNLKNLEGRKWDVVLDTSSFMPNEVLKSATLLAPNIQHYIYISSTAVYKDWSSPKMNEDSPVFNLNAPDAAQYDAFQRYGAAKAACEAAVTKVLPDRNTVIRSDTIVGPGDSHHRYTYWIKRASEGGEILGPGKPGDYVQYIDVRDLAQWIVHCAEKRVQGTFNASSPASSYTMENMIADAQSATNKPSSITWVDTEYLDSQPIRDIPFWMPHRNTLLGIGRLSVEKAMQNGLQSRPKIETARDVYAAYEGLSPEEQKLGNVGLTRDDEKELIAGWKKLHSQNPQ